MKNAGIAIVLALWAVPVLVKLFSSEAVRSEIRLVLRAWRDYWRGGWAARASAALGAVALAWAVAWGGSKPPSVHTEKGIVLDGVIQTAQSITFRWHPDDTRIEEGDDYLVQQRIGGDWITLGQTATTSFVYHAFTPHRTGTYRIAVRKEGAE